MTSAIVRPSAGARGHALAAASVDRGAVTVELALALPVLGALLLVALWAVGVAGSSMTCTDAARAGARAAARGENPAAVAALVRSLSPSGATVTISNTADTVTVLVVARSRPLGPWHLPAIGVHSIALARLEFAPPVPAAR